MTNGEKQQFVRKYQFHNDVIHSEKVAEFNFYPGSRKSTILIWQWKACGLLVVQSKTHVFPRIRLSGLGREIDHAFVCVWGGGT